jgi:gliding motility-associated-like protein
MQRHYLEIRNAGFVFPVKHSYQYIINWPLLVMICAFYQLIAVGENPMHVKQYNFYSFPVAEKTVTEELKRLTPKSFHTHPEFGILPFNAQCSDCSELIHKRTADSRYFIGNGSNGKRVFLQKSFFPLHMQNNEGEWITIDERLKKISDTLYAAASQPFPTYYNTATHTTALFSGGFTFFYNQRLRKYFLNKEGVVINAEMACKDNYSIGFEGVRISEAWPNIAIEHTYKLSGIKTDFVIEKPLNIPRDALWLVFEDAITLPDHFSFQKKEKTLALLNEYNQEIITWHQPQYYDGYSYGAPGSYELQREGGQWLVRVMVPVSLLQDSKVRYPLRIDPWVSAGPQGIGAFAVPFPGTFNSANMGFTFGATGSCDYSITFVGLGGSRLVNVYLDVEYENKFNPCNPGVNPPYCEFSDVSMEVIGPCGLSTGQLICNPALPPFNGTCTTDPLKVPAARALLIPNFLNCIEPQCPDYELTFTIKNREFKCNDNCERNCATGHRFAVTLEGRTIEETVTISDDVVCAGEQVQVTSLPRYGVPPYTYLWNPTGQTDSIITVYPETSTFYSCIVTDLCGNTAEDDTLITVVPSPDADAGGLFSVCAGGFVQIGGSPTSVNGFDFQWQAVPVYANAFLSQANVANPVVYAPADSTGSYVFIVRVADALCFRYDTARVEIYPNPNPVIIPNPVIFICENGSALLQTDTTYDSYQWSDGSNTRFITITQPGTYSVTVSKNGCTGSSSPVSAQIKPLLPFNIIPEDTSFNIGGSVTFRATIDLNNPLIENYYWEPFTEISCTGCPDPTATPTSDRYYFLYVQQDGCLSVDSAFVDVIFPNKYAIPSAFTPNNDGKNDKFFIIKQSGVTVKEFKIFNRWGEMVHDAVFPWDGYYKGQLQDMEVFTYFFRLEFSDGTAEIVKGNVTLVR